MHPDSKQSLKPHWLTYLYLTLKEPVFRFIINCYRVIITNFTQAILPRCLFFCSRRNINSFLKSCRDFNISVCQETNMALEVMKNSEFRYVFFLCKHTLYNHISINLVVKCCLEFRYINTMEFKTCTVWKRDSNSCWPLLLISSTT